MSQGDIIPPVDALGTALAQIEDLHDQSATAARRHNAQLLWIVACLLAIVMCAAGSVFALIVRNNVVILPDRARKAESSAATKTFLHAPLPSAGEKENPTGLCTAEWLGGGDPFRGLDSAAARRRATTTPAGGVLLSASRGDNF